MSWAVTRLHQQVGRRESRRKTPHAWDGEGVMLSPRTEACLLVPPCLESRRLCWGIRLQPHDCQCRAGKHAPGRQVEVLLDLGRMVAAVPTAAFPSGASAILLLLQMSEAPQRSHRDLYKMRMVKPFKAFRGFGIKTGVFPQPGSPVWGDPCPDIPTASSGILPLRQTSDGSWK